MRIMAGADRIAAHLLHDLELAFQSPGIDHGSKRPQVAMQADALQGDVLAVEKESFEGVELDGADAEKGLLPVDDGPVLLDGGDRPVEAGLFQAPEAGIGNLEFRLGGGASFGGNGKRNPVGGRDGGGIAIARRIDDSLDFDADRGPGGIVQRGLEIGRGGGGGDIGRGRKDSPMSDMDRGCLYQPYVSVDAGSRVPAGRIGRIVEAHGDNVGLARHDIGGEIDAIRGVTIGPAARALPVDPDRGVGHGPIDIEEEFLSAIGGGNVKMLPIPRHAPEAAFPRLIGRIGDERPFDGPIMRQIEEPPSAVVEIGLGIGDASVGIPGGARRLHRRIGDEVIGGRQHPRLESLISQLSDGIGGILLKKTPIAVEEDALARRSVRTGWRSLGGGKREGKGREDADEPDAHGGGKR